jgi:hypothetical protein
MALLPTAAVAWLRPPVASNGRSLRISRRLLGDVTHVTHVVFHGVRADASRRRLRE